MSAVYVDCVDADAWGVASTEEEHDDACVRATEWLSQHEGRELSITMRPCQTGRHGELPGLYHYRAGRLHTARYSTDSVTEEVRELVRAAYEAVMESWPATEVQP